jgi:hypothetical protein
MFESIQVDSADFELKSKGTLSDSASDRMQAKLAQKHMPLLFG